MTDKLTKLSKTGGCGCKMSQAQLRELLSQQFPVALAPNDKLIAGNANNDDALIWRLSDSQALVASVDFFTPIVDDPFDFGTIAAANAISDIYACGATPIFALEILAMPTSKLSNEQIAQIMQGGRQVAEQCACAILGGHSIEIDTPVYGLCAIGTVAIEHIKLNHLAKPGDAILLSKPLGIGLLAMAHQQGSLSDAGYLELVEHASTLNKIGETLGKFDSVHAMCDVTGFGLLAHLDEVCKASSVQAELFWDKLPVIETAHKIAAAGQITGSATRHWQQIKHIVCNHASISKNQFSILCDPQTNGGLLIFCDQAEATNILDTINSQQNFTATQIGRTAAATTEYRIVIHTD